MEKCHWCSGIQMEKCHWCSEEFESEELTVLDINMPNYAGPKIRIKNNLCPGCSLASRKALAAVEMQIKKTVNAE